MKLKKSKVAKIIDRIATENSVSVAEVRSDMQESIDAGYENRNNNDYARTFWGQWGGRKPTIEEFLIESTKKKDPSWTV